MIILGESLRKPIRRRNMFAFESSKFAIEPLRERHEKDTNEFVDIFMINDTLNTLLKLNL